MMALVLVGTTGNAGGDYEPIMNVDMDAGS